ncbi:hypothetical protein Aab01nite_76440 [Paractinoplanes abujensis]|uniref:Putative membrane protein YeaQ/YmgE (Transglycosylase-associated protein family) n=1 Tax=Paractinoplanes abujensis TaxID=882441 RepID=A0A7W7G1T4_9ACTN|nr:hypothetical protein [Actinoplanes abujensis]MBB4692470.1 putative membrane protein YeaQ/YmgE (transglycosylase-associated protein family) [Actinoplanes abujensis]GID24054.1 hypothetical protein Aab01nite_76440 [Actinoplanes abujensis]
MKYFLALLGAVLFGLPGALLAHTGAETRQADPDPRAAAAVVYPGQALAVEEDPFRVDQAAWLRFMMARETRAPMVGPAPPATADVAAARARADAAGWHTADGPPDMYDFEATKGDVRLLVYRDFTNVVKQDAWWVTALTVLGGLAGAALGAWLTLAAWRSSRRRTPRSRTVIRETAVVGAALLLPLLAQTGLKLFSVTEPDLPYSAQLLIELARWPAVLGLLLLAAAVLTLRYAPVRNAAR